MLRTYISIRYAAFLVHVVHVPLQTRGTKGIASTQGRHFVLVINYTLAVSDADRDFAEFVLNYVINSPFLIKRHYGYNVRSKLDICNTGSSHISHQTPGTESRRFNSIETTMRWHTTLMRSILRKKKALTMITLRIEIHYYVIALLHHAIRVRGMNSSYALRVYHIN